MGSRDRDDVRAILFFFFKPQSRKRRAGGEMSRKLSERPVRCHVLSLISLHRNEKIFFVTVRHLNIYVDTNEEIIGMHR